jgi:hypothetical protein
MDSLNLLLECQVFGGLLSLAIDVLAVDPQRLGTDGFVLGAPRYFDFFCRCMFSVNSPISRFSSSFSRLSLLYCSTDTTASPVS